MGDLLDIPGYICQHGDRITPDQFCFTLRPREGGPICDLVLASEDVAAARQRPDLFAAALDEHHRRQPHVREVEAQVSRVGTDPTSVSVVSRPRQ